MDRLSKDQKKREKRDFNFHATEREAPVTARKPNGYGEAAGHSLVEKFDKGGVGLWRANVGSIIMGACGT
jgi:hypothetical protein